MHSLQERQERQSALRQKNEAAPAEQPLSLGDCARLMKVSLSTARRIFVSEPGVIHLRTRPSSKHIIIRVPREVFNRVMRRSGTACAKKATPLPPAPSLPDVRPVDTRK